MTVTNNKNNKDYEDRRLLSCINNDKYGFFTSSNAFLYI